VGGVLSADERKVRAEIELLYHRGTGELRPVAARRCFACAARHRCALIAVLAAAALATGTSVSWLPGAACSSRSDSVPDPIRRRQIGVTSMNTLTLPTPGPAGTIVVEEHPVRGSSLAPGGVLLALALSLRARRLRGLDVLRRSQDRAPPARS
jgi:hypothetical protein